MAASLLATDEYRDDAVVTEYLLNLDRDPADEEVAIWLAYPRRRGDIRDVRRALLASDEFYAGVTQGLDIGFGVITTR